MTSKLVAGVDSSTQSCKVELRRVEDGTVVGAGSAPHPSASPPSSEQDPHAWWEPFRAAFAGALLDASPHPEDVQAISIAAQCHGLVVLDEDDRVIRPAKLWNDTTSTPELNSLRATIGDQAMVRRIGSLPTAAFTLSKIAWLAGHEPENFSRVRRIMLPHDYLTFRLTGRAVTDRSEASGTAYFDAAKGEYVVEYLELIAQREWLPMLPEVLGPEEVAGEVSDAVLSELGLTGPVLVGAGGGDQHAAALGLGMVPGDVMYSFGTSGVVMTVSEEPVYDELGHVDGVADMTNGYVPLVSTLNAAKVTDTFAKILRVSHGEMSELAMAAPRGARLGTRCLPGRRTYSQPAGCIGPAERHHNTNLTRAGGSVGVRGRDLWAIRRPAFTGTGWRSAGRTCTRGRRRCPVAGLHPITGRHRPGSRAAPRCIRGHCSRSRSPGRSRRHRPARHRRTRRLGAGDSDRS
jgi:xylulokinase